MNEPRIPLGQNTNNVRQVEEIIYYIHIPFPKMSVICILDKRKPHGEFPGIDCTIGIRTTHWGIIDDLPFLFLYLCLLRCDCNFDAKVNDISLQKKTDPTWHLTH